MAVSIIIPALNEAGCLAGTLQSLRRQSPAEIIVVDGGSSDGTLAAAQGADQILVAPPGRAAQMNAGAAKACGDILLFLHADCTLEDGAVAAVQRCLRVPNIAACCFHMHVTASGWAFRAIDSCATARVRLTGIVYGDQGLALRRDDFVRLGGFPQLRFMEDVMFSLRLRPEGKVVVLPQKVYVSPRRWQKVGLLRQTLRNWALTALAAAGVHPDALARFYANVR